MALAFIRAQGGVPEASVATTDIATSAVNAALANAMCAHANETDDADPSTALHPGAAVVPPVLAIAERENRSGRDALNAVALGYDISVRFVRALGGFSSIRDAHRTAESYGGSVGAGAAAGALLNLDESQMAYVLSWTIQQAGGVYTWPRDLQHIEKSFIFTGQSARNGVTAAEFVRMGATGVPNVLDGEHNALEALATTQKPEELTNALGQRFMITESNIKSWGIGMPIQSAVDATLKLMRQHGFGAADVMELTAALPPHMAPVVNNRSMPDVNLHYILSVVLLDGELSFDASHSFERMRDPQVLAVKERIRLVGDPNPSLEESDRSALVEVKLRDGRTVSEFTRYPPGSPRNPLTDEALEAKARRLMAPVLGDQRAEAAIEMVRGLERVRSIRELMPLLSNVPQRSV